MNSSVTLRVYATPGPQGSKSFKGYSGGKAIMVESSKKVKPWREAVVWAAREADVKIAGPVTVGIYFTLAKPRSAPKKRRTFPDRKPDLSKLIRATEDALVDAGTIEDDARIVRIVAEKVFPGEHVYALDVPGAYIAIHSVYDEAAA
jgi:Holliday junction resolvase RusA-like endonuclease